MSGQLTSLVGIFLMVGVGWIFSENRRKMNWRVIGWGIALQLLFAAFVFRVPAGRDFFLLLNDLVVKVLGAASAGTEFVFGRLAVGPGGASPAGESLGFFLAFQVLPAVIFFSALMALLYWCGVMPLLIKAFARVFTRLMRISGAESLCAASNVFVGVESALTVKPHLTSMTRSELCTVLTAGMATIASSVMAAYVAMLHGTFPTIAGHLMSASILSAPAAIVMAKVLVPESGSPATMGKSVRLHYDRESNPFLAIINGANDGLKLVMGVTALLLAGLGLVALFNMGLAWAGGHVNAAAGWSGTWSLESCLKYCFYPLAVATGADPVDAGRIAGLLGSRVVTTELPAYLQLAGSLDQMSPRSVVIATYALCGFAHLPSMAIFIGGTAALAPQTAHTLSSVGLRALVAATLACLQTACVAGLLWSGSTILN